MNHKESESKQLCPNSDIVALYVQCKTQNSTKSPYNDQPSHKMIIPISFSYSTTHYLLVSKNDDISMS